MENTPVKLFTQAVNGGNSAVVNVIIWRLPGFIYDTKLNMKWVFSVFAFTVQ